jgi:signal transduction histidine kinase
MFKKERSKLLFHLQEIFRSPVPFESSRKENSYRRRSAAAALKSELAGFLIGSALALVVFIIRSSELNYSGIGVRVQLLRGILGVLLLSVYFFIKRRPLLYLRNHSKFLSAIVFASLLIFSVIIYELSKLEVVTPLAILMSVIVVVGLVFSLADLSPKLIFMGLAPVNCAMLAVASGMGHGNVLSIAFHLLLINLIGYFARYSFKSRDRALFLESWALREARNEIRRKNDELVSLNSQRERIVQFLHHDLSQPLASINIYCSHIKGLLKKIEGTEEAGRSLLAIQTCASAIQSSFESSLALYRDSKLNQQSVALSDFDIVETISSSIQVVAPNAERNRVSLRLTHRSVPGIFVRSNRELVFEILTNFLSNAIRYQKPHRSSGGAVLIGLVRLGEVVRVDIIDNGLGISQGDIEKIFNPDWRASSSFSLSPEGRGLGLASVKASLAILSGHSLRVSSKLGSGTRFSLLLPRGDLPSV